MPELLEKVRTMNSLEGGRFKKVKNLWVEVISDGENTITPPVDKGAFATVEEAIAHKIATEQAEEEVKTTQWWKDNHFQRYTFVDGSYQLAEVPTYIWMRTEPNDPKYIKSQQPSIKFRTYKVYDGTMEDREGKTPNYLNEKFNTMNDGIPVPKEGYLPMTGTSVLKILPSPKTRLISVTWNKPVKIITKPSHLPDNKKMGDILAFLCQNP
jgi:hypothetical protein